MRIATWNLQRPSRTNAKRWLGLREQIAYVDADVWILTETHRRIVALDGYSGHHSLPIERIHSGGECRTSIWSRWDVLDVVGTHDNETSICVSILAPMGPMLVYGTIIPYGGAGQKHRYRSNGIDQDGQASWQLHYAAIDRLKQDWSDLKKRFPQHGVCVGGDFNQARDGRGRYGTVAGQMQLTGALEASSLLCVTEQDFFASGVFGEKSVIDHLCFDSDLATRVCNVQPWDANLIEGKPISDHGGVLVEIASQC